MTKKINSYYDKFIAKLTPAKRKKFEDEHREFLISEMLIVAMQKDEVSVRKLAELAD